MTGSQARNDDVVMADLIGHLPYSTARTPWKASLAR